MLFNSLTFIIFFALFLLGWAYAPLRRNTHLRLLYIVAGSAIFYGWWDWRFLLLILSTGLVDFTAALAMGKTKSSALRKILLASSLVFDLGMLAIFKYSSFIAVTLESLFSNMGITVDLQGHIPAFCLILPVGISFYTFQSLSYTIDVYRGELPPTRNFIHFMAYLMFFPQLVAGPIVRAKDLLYRLTEEPSFTSLGMFSGTKLVIIGFFKKCFLADNIAIYVNTTFSGGDNFDSTLLWYLSMILFSIQIYCDFSGYSDIARGLAKILGYRFPLNFNHPYFSAGFSDFWRRWHISLSSWFSNYVYIPLGGNVEKYKGRTFFNRLRTLFNLMATMLLSGIWHGAAWTFVAWGAVHGALMSLERILNLPGLFKGRKGRLVWTALTLVLIPFTWIPFRAESFSQIQHILGCFLKYSPLPEDSNILDSLPFIGFFIAMELFLYLHPVKYLPYTLSRAVRRLDYIGFALLATITIFFRGGGNEFIYFQF